MISGYAAAPSLAAGHTPKPKTMLIQDRSSHIPFSKILNHGDIVLLLTPVVLHADGDPSQDPFETLGRGIAKYHPWLRHVPYTPQSGITSTHVGFIQRAKLIVFVITGPPSSGQPSQVDLSSVVQVIGDHRPHVVVACCDVRDLEPAIASFPTVLQIPGYSTRELENGADLLYLGRPTQPPPPPEVPLQAPPITMQQRWSVTGWDHTRDMPAVLELWRQCMPPQFQKIRQHSLFAMLHRDGYAKHFVVREPGTNMLLGFCASYITYLDSKGEVLVGSIAALMVRASHRGQGIGSILHTEALRSFKRTRGVGRLQLGSTFPRLLYGVPIGHSSESWFQRKGWQMDGTGLGTGKEACDWVLAFDEWPTAGFPTIGGVTFRACRFADFDRVLEVVERESERNGNMGWYDQYAKLADSTCMTDIMLGWRGNEIVATAITYVLNSDNPCAEDLPWPGSISEGTGGVTCICITGKSALLVGIFGSLFCARSCAKDSCRCCGQRRRHGAAARRLCSSSAATREE